MPLNKKHLLDFLNFSKTLRTHPHISNFCPDHGVGLATLSFVTKGFIHSCLVLLFIVNMDPFVYSINAVLMTSLVWEEGEAESKFTGKSIIRTQTEAVLDGGLVVFCAGLGFAQRSQINSF